MKTVCCLLVAVLAATCTARTNRQSELQQFLLQAHRSQQLEGILRQYGNQIPDEITQALEALGLQQPNAVVAAPAPEKSKYKFAGMEKLSANELRAVNVFLDEYFEQRDREFVKFQPPKLKIRTPRQPCRVDDDCPFQQFCFDISEELFKDMSTKGYGKYYKMVMTMLDIKTKECSPRFADLLINDVETYMSTFRSAFEKIKVVVDKTKKINGMRGWIDRVEKNLIKPFNFTHVIEEPLAQKRQAMISNTPGYAPQPVSYGQSPYGGYPQGGYPQGGYPQGGYGGYPQSQPQPNGYYIYPQPQPAPQPSASSDSSLSLLLPLLMMGGGDQNMQQLLPLILLMGGDGGAGDLSPLLLISVMGMGNNNLFSNGNNMLTLLMLTQFMGSDSGGADSYMLPLLLIMSQNQANADNSFMTLLPLLLFSGSGLDVRSGHDLYCPPGSGQNSLVQILLFSTLFNISNTGSNLNPLFLILLLQPNDGCPGSGIGITEIILIQSMSGGNMGNIFTGGNSLLPLLVLSGLGTGGSGSIDPALLLLTMLPGNNNNSLSSLLPILFLSDPNFAQDPLAFLLLFNNNLFGSTGGNNMNMLFLLLFLGQGSSGYSQPITTPYGITQPNPNIPQPGGPPFIQQSPGVVQAQPAPQGGLLGGLGGGNGIFTLLLLSNLMGGGNMGSNQLLLLLLLSGNGLF